MKNQIYLIAALCMTWLLAGCEWWEIEVAPADGYVFECRMQCVVWDNTGSGNLITVPFYRGNLCVNGHSSEMYSLASAEHDALELCARTIQPTCAEGAYLMHPTVTEDPLTGETYPCHSVEVSVVEVAGSPERCEGPCSAGVMSDPSAGNHIQLDRDFSYVNVTGFDGTIYPTEFLDGHVYLAGGDCPGGGCDVTIAGLELGMASDSTYSFKGVELSQLHAYLLRNPTSTISSGGAWTLGPESLRFDATVSASTESSRVLLEPFYNFSPATFRFLNDSGEFAADIDLTDEVGNAYAITLYGTVTNRPPMAVMTSSVSETTCGGATVELDGSGTTDPDGEDDIVNYIWVLDQGELGESALAAGPIATVEVPEGSHTITLQVLDRAGAISEALETIEVASGQDTSPPVIESIELAADCIFPPNHKYAVLELGSDIVVHATDDCGPVDVVLSASSSEPDNGLGDGDTSDDVVQGVGGICLRGERSGTADGRVYTVEVLVSDGAGNVATEEVSVTVPHDASGGHSRSCARPTADECPLEPLPDDEPAWGCSAPGAHPRGAANSTAAIALLALFALVGVRRRRAR